MENPISHKTTLELMDSLDNLKGTTHKISQREGVKYNLINLAFKRYYTRMKVQEDLEKDLWINHQRIKNQLKNNFS